MKIVIFGLSISSSWGNGHATIWRALTRALAGRGHKIIFFERDAPYYAAHRDMTAFDGVDLVLYDSWAEALGSAKAHLSGADAGIITSYCPDGIEASELVLASGVRHRVFYDLDTPVTLRVLKSGHQVDYIGKDGLKDFDIVLSYTGGAALSGLKEALGAKNVYPLYGSVDPDMHRPAAISDKYRADLSYLGTYAEDRQEALERLFIEPSRRLPGKKFLLGGSLYPQGFPWKGNIFFIRHVPPHEHPAFYSSSLFTLNITRAAMAGMGYCPSGRLFEAAACQSHILTDYWAGLEDFFTPGVEITVAQTPEDIIEALNMPEEERVKIAKAARERVLSEHTASKRVMELEAILAGC